MHVHSYEHGVDVVAAVFLILFTIIIQISVYAVLHATKDTFEGFFPKPNIAKEDGTKIPGSFPVFQERSRGYSRVPGTFDISAFR